MTIPIFGLDTRGRDVLLIARALVDTAGVVRAYVNPEVEMAYVEYDPTVARPADLVAAVGRAGFEAGEPSLR